MSNAVDKELLDQIYAEYVRLSRGKKLPAFGGSHLRGAAMLNEYKRFLKSLSPSIFGRNGCKPPCGDGSCPPCTRWGRRKYLEFLEKLRSKSA